MCGIAGFIGKINIPSDRMAATLLAIEHRGPDSFGEYSHAGNKVFATLLHRRLAIIDLDERSGQPFFMGDCVLIYNGEIYNYLEIRKELINLGRTFYSKSDTEVLAAALTVWGEDALDKLEGMWSFAWYDTKKETLLLSRDRFGEKPLYIWERPEGLYFSSEIKALASLAGVWPDINENHVWRYMINGYKSLYKTNETYYKGITELSSGTTLTLFPNGEKKHHKYWNPEYQINHQMSYQDAVEQTKSALIEAVRIRLRADVPLAFCMSGGIDSNSLISIARNVLNQEVHGFTILNTDARYEEQTLVEQAVKEQGLRHTGVPLTQSGFLDNMQKLVTSHDGPVATISYYVHWQLMQAIASEGYKVTISGTAADEIFTGYYDHHNLYLKEVYSDPALFQESLGHWEAFQKNIVRNPYLQNPYLYIENEHIRDHVYLNNDEFSSWFHGSWQEPFTETAYPTDLLRKRMLNEMFAEAVPVILHEDDLNAMYFSMENRSPFLDRNLFEFAYSIPSKHLIQKGLAKSVLRDAMRGIVPDAILDNKRKVGFNAPILELVDVHDKNTRSFLLDNSPIFDFIKRDKIEALLNQSELPNSFSKFLFYFINSKILLDNKH